MKYTAGKPYFSKLKIITYKKLICQFFFTPLTNRGILPTTDISVYNEIGGAI